MLLTLLLLNLNCQELADKQRLARQALATKYISYCINHKGSLSFCLRQTRELLEDLKKEDDKELTEHCKGI